MKKLLLLGALLMIPVIILTGNGISFNEGVDNADFLTDLEKNVILEQNLARTNPVKFASFLEERLQYYSGRYLQLPGRITIRTNEGVTAVREAIAFLKRQNAIEPLKLSKGMSRAAQDYAKYQGPQGLVGHFSGGTSPSSRVNKYGRWQRTVAENIDYGWNSGRDVIMALIVDDGVSSRGHRKNIFSTRYAIVGVGCGTHQRYRHMCVMNYAGGYLEGK